ncbi:TetR/AcrR family transcriptional regulator [Thalassotalea sp. HSM 43]|uniref:TetR/AcrR family transcriptional regulator n=1 Tax=Thalassotalea sp. HSM 43 TaxID=2552945 RepID=UPI001678B694|nr:TetR/AcrR family transcriptional regulator [Thalassotalea sp. HSM 43]
MTQKIRTRSKSEEKRESILIAAVNCFCEKGFANTSMDYIAKQAGVSKQTVYSHFGSKDDLFMASVSKKCQEFRQAAFDTDKDIDVSGALVNFAVEFIRLLLSDEGMSVHRLCVSESQANPKVSQLFYQAGPEPVIKGLSELLQGYKQQNLLDIEDTHLASLQFLSLVKGEAVMRREYNTQWQPTQQQTRDYIEASVALFLSGYGFKTS